MDPSQMNWPTQRNKVRWTIEYFFMMISKISTEPTTPLAFFRNHPRYFYGFSQPYNKTESRNAAFFICVASTLNRY